MENYMEVFSVFQWTSSILRTKKLRPLIQHCLLLQDRHKRKKNKARNELQVLPNLRIALLSKFQFVVTVAGASLHHCSKTLRKDNLKN